MADSTHTRPVPDEGEGEAADLLRLIHRLPESTQWLVGEYIDVMTRRREERVHHLEDRVDDLEQGGGRIIRTERLEVVDGAGRVRAAIGQHQDTFGLELYDSAGAERAWLNMHEDGAPGLYLSNNGNVVVHLSVGDHGVGLHLLDADGHPGFMWHVEDDGAVSHGFGAALR